MIIRLLFILFFSAVTPVLAQLPAETGGTDEQLAAHYFQEKDFEKAAYYYEKLYASKPIDFYYQHLLTSYLGQDDFKSAEKLVKRRQKQHQTAIAYDVDLGFVYLREGSQEKANKVWKEAIDGLTASPHQVNELAHAFRNRNEPALALEVYQKGRKLLKGQYTFHFEIAELKGQQGDMQGMIAEYLDVLDVNVNYVQQVQNNLARELMRSGGEELADLLRQELLRKSQKQPDQSIYYELLIWYFMQEKDFFNALIHAKAMDKRLREDGGRVYSLSRMAVEVKDYDAAVQGFTYILEKGQDTYYYIPARIELLQALTRKVTEQGRYEKSDLFNLEQQYHAALREIGRKSATAPLVKELAHLYAFYLDNTDKAIELLEEVIEMPGVPGNLVAEAKMELADIMLIIGEIWEASLLYSQVDKAFKHDPIGDMAKYKNARLSYFNGDFKWAEAQLEVLKGSTSKLIANDALQLSLLISDNSTIDTNTVPLLMYARAELLSYRNHDDEALATLDSINTYFPGHDLADEILYRKARIMEKKQLYEKAAELYQQLVNAYSYDLLADDALFRMAELHQFYFNDPDKARDLYQRILTEHQGSLYVVEARKRFRELRGDNIN